MACADDTEVAAGVGDGEEQEDDTKLQRFIQWLQANGADLRGCTIRRCCPGQGGYGVFATESPAGINGVVLVVPLDLAITPMRVLQDPVIGARCRALFEEDGGVDDRLLVMMFLMVERLRPESTWKPYLDMLPSSFGSSLWFSDDELSELKGTTLYRATILQKKSLQEEFYDKVKGLVEEFLCAYDATRTFEVQFEDFLWANSIFWTRALNIPLPHFYVFPKFLGDGNSSNHQFSASSDLVKNGHDNISEASGYRAKECNSTMDRSSGPVEPRKQDPVWVEGLVPGIDFCNHDLKALATWEVDPLGDVSGLEASMYLLTVDQKFIEVGKEIFINYGNKGNEELLYLYGFVIDNNPDDYLMVNYPVEALQNVHLFDRKKILLQMQKAELRCLLSRRLLDNGFFNCASLEENNKKTTSTTHLSAYSWSGQRKVPSYQEKMVFPQEFITALRTLALQEHELDLVSSLLQELADSDEGRQFSETEVQAAIWEVCGDHGALGLFVDLLRVKVAELEEGTGTEASDDELLRELCFEKVENAVSKSNGRNKGSYWSSLVYRRGQKKLARLFLQEAEHALELCSKEEKSSGAPQAEELVCSRK